MPSPPEQNPTPAMQLPGDTQETFGRPFEQPATLLDSDFTPGFFSDDVSDTGEARRHQPTQAESIASIDRLFHLRRLIGVGGTAEVWESEQLCLKRRVAIKKVRPQQEKKKRHGDSSTIPRQIAFRAEALITASLEHPNILPIYDLSEDENGMPLLAMKLIDGAPWDKAIQSDFRQLSVRDFLGRHLEILKSVAQAVAFSHARGILHRDIKPSQVLLGGFGEVLLIDWGLAMAYDRTMFTMGQSKDLYDLVPNMETANNPAGTLAFMAPEQTYTHRSGLGPWTDIYLLGGTLYYLLTGRLPHPSSDPRTCFEEARRGWYIDPTQFGGERSVPKELVQLVHDCMRERPTDRIQCATEFLARIQEYLTGASQRRHSLEISDALGRDTSPGELPDDYRSLVRLLDRAEESLILWSGNPTARRLRGEFLRALATRALSHHDLMMAETYADKIDDGVTRQDLLEEVTRRRKRDRRRDLQRCWMTRLTVVLFVVATVLALLFYIRSVDYRERLRAAEERAFHAGGGAPAELP